MSQKPEQSSRSLPALQTMQGRVPASPNKGNTSLPTTTTTTTTTTAIATTAPATATTSNGNSSTVSTSGPNSTNGAYTHPQHAPQPHNTAANPSLAARAPTTTMPSSSAPLNNFYQSRQQGPPSSSNLQSPSQPNKPQVNSAGYRGPATSSATSSSLSSTQPLRPLSNHGQFGTPPPPPPPVPVSSFSNVPATVATTHVANYPNGSYSQGNGSHSSGFTNSVNSPYQAPAYATTSPATSLPTKHYSGSTSQAPQTRPTAHQASTSKRGRYGSSVPAARSSSAPTATQAARLATSSSYSNYAYAPPTTYTATGMPTTPGVPTTQAYYPATTTAYARSQGANTQASQYAYASSPAVSTPLTNHTQQTQSPHRAYLPASTPHTSTTAYGRSSSTGSRASRASSSTSLSSPYSAAYAPKPSTAMPASSYPYTSSTQGYSTTSNPAPFPNASTTSNSPASSRGASHRRSKGYSTSSGPYQPTPGPKCSSRTPPCSSRAVPGQYYCREHMQFTAPPTTATFTPSTPAPSTPAPSTVAKASTHTSSTSVRCTYVNPNTSKRCGNMYQRRTPTARYCKLHEDIVSRKAASLGSATATQQQQQQQQQGAKQGRASAPRPSSSASASNDKPTKSKSKKSYMRKVDRRTIDSRRRKLTKHLRDLHIPRHSPALAERLSHHKRLHPQKHGNKGKKRSTSVSSSLAGKDDNDYDSSDPEVDDDEVMFSPLMADRIRTRQKHYWKHDWNVGLSESDDDSDGTEHDHLPLQTIITPKDAYRKKRKALQRLIAIYQNQFRQLKLRLMRARMEYVDKRKQASYTTTARFPFNATPKIAKGEPHLCLPPPLGYDLFEETMSSSTPQPFPSGEERAMHIQQLRLRDKSVMKVLGGSGLARFRCAHNPKYLPPCTRRALPFSSFCGLHILNDSSQTLFKACTHISESGTRCQMPTLRFADPAVCAAHLDLAALKRNPRLSLNAETRATPSGPSVFLGVELSEPEQALLFPSLLHVADEEEYDKSQLIAAGLQLQNEVCGGDGVLPLGMLRLLKSTITVPEHVLQAPDDAPPLCLDMRDRGAEQSSGSGDRKGSSSPIIDIIVLEEEYNRFQSEVDEFQRQLDEWPDSSMVKQELEALSESAMDSFIDDVTSAIVSELQSAVASGVNSAFTSALHSRAQSPPLPPTSNGNSSSSRKHSASSSRAPTLYRGHSSPSPSSTAATSQYYVYNSSQLEGLQATPRSVRGLSAASPIARSPSRSTSANPSSLTAQQPQSYSFAYPPSSPSSKQATIATTATTAGAGKKSPRTPRSKSRARKKSTPASPISSSLASTSYSATTPAMGSTHALTKQTPGYASSSRVGAQSTTANRAPNHGSTRTASLAPSTLSGSRPAYYASTPPQVATGVPYTGSNAGQQLFYSTATPPPTTVSRTSLSAIPTTMTSSSAPTSSSQSSPYGTMPAQPGAVGRTSNITTGTGRPSQYTGYMTSYAPTQSAQRGRGAKKAPARGRRAPTQPRAPGPPQQQPISYPSSMAAQYSARAKTPQQGYANMPLSGTTPIAQSMMANATQGKGQNQNASSTYATSGPSNAMVRPVQTPSTPAPSSNGVQYQSTCVDCEICRRNAALAAQQQAASYGPATNGAATPTYSSTAQYASQYASVPSTMGSGTMAYSTRPPTPAVATTVAYGTTSGYSARPQAPMTGSMAGTRLASPQSANLVGKTQSSVTGTAAPTSTASVVQYAPLTQMSSAGKYSPSTVPAMNQPQPPRASSMHPYPPPARSSATSSGLNPPVPVSARPQASSRASALPTTTPPSSAPSANHGQSSAVVTTHAATTPTNRPQQQQQQQQQQQGTTSHQSFRGNHLPSSSSTPQTQSASQPRLDATPTSQAETAATQPVSTSLASHGMPSHPPPRSTTGSETRPVPLTKGHAATVPMETAPPPPPPLASSSPSPRLAVSAPSSAPAPPSTVTAPASQMKVPPRASQTATTSQASVSATRPATSQAAQANSNGDPPTKRAKVMAPIGGRSVADGSENSSFAQ